MKIKYKEKIDGYTVITQVDDAVVDPQKTMAKIANLITPEMTEDNIRKLFNENPVYAKVGPEAELIDNAVADQIQKRLEDAGKNRRLLDNGEYIDDYRGVEYQIKKSGKWEKAKIEEIGVTLPKGAVLRENLTGEQQEEIAAQKEEERLAALTPEERAKEETAKIKARLEEIDRLDGPRSIREAVAQMAESSGLDTSYIMRHEEEAVALREELSALAVA